MAGLVKVLLDNAVRLGASAVHLEPERTMCFTPAISKIVGLQYDRVWFGRSMRQTCSPLSRFRRTM